MTAPLYEVIHSLALKIVDASARNDENSGAEAYAVLKELCESNEGTKLDHPLQWEALGDFSESYIEAQTAYEKGLSCSSRLKLAEYSASIKLAMAESHFDNQNLKEAKRLAAEAKIEATKIKNMELRSAINEFLIQVSHT
ncbi:hypothetical protein [Spongiibacter tropicus]|uniref:hypothetical protein n=1 Tax=Spongiibacter tropicus TaxID=454602 RepID=UPI0003B465EC|nr:hypothetical protein [Spongiibacter tropicus]